MRNKGVIKGDTALELILQGSNVVWPNTKPVTPERGSWDGEYCVREKAMEVLGRTVLGYRE